MVWKELLLGVCGGDITLSHNIPRPLLAPPPSPPIQPGNSTGWTDIPGKYRHLWGGKTNFQKLSVNRKKMPQNNRKANRQKEKKSLRYLGSIWEFCGIWPKSFQPMGLATASTNVLGKSLPFPLEFKARVKEAVRRCQAKDGLGLQTGFVCGTLRHLPNGGLHWRAV